MNWPTLILGAAIIGASVLALFYPASIKSRLNVFMILALLSVMVYAILEGQWAKAAALGVVVIINMEIDRGWKP